MSNASLKKKIEAAFTPYAKAFCAKPGQAAITVMVDDADAICVFTMSAADHAVIDADANFKSVITRAYNGLVRHVSQNGRTPILGYQST